MIRGGNKLRVGQKIQHKAREGYRLSRDLAITYDLHFEYFDKLPQANLAYYANLKSFKNDFMKDYDHFGFKINAVHSAYEFKLILEVPQAIFKRQRITGPTEDAQI